MMDYRERWELKHYLLRKVLDGRIRLFHVALFALLLGFLLNFWYLQGVRGEEYKTQAENNRLRRLPILPTRGELFDREHQVLASTRPSVSLSLQREGVPELELRAQLQRLAPILGIPYPLLRERLDAMESRPDFEPLLLAEDVHLEELAQIEARRERFPSVEVQQTARRHYPYEDLFAHVVGYVGEVSTSQLNRQDDSGDLVSGDIVGKSGVERTYDERIRGNRGWKLVSVNNLGRQMAAERVGLEARHGQRMSLTLDLEMQRTLRAALGGEVGAGVFIDARTGAVLALVSAPTFDPNRFASGISHEDWKTITEDPRRPLHDRAIASFYAPGSTFKIFMAVAGLESGVINPSRTVFCTGSAMHYGRPRLCWKKGGHGEVNVELALAHSCNVFFYQLGRDLGIERIHEYGKQFGLGRLTGIDVPGEEPGILPSSAWKREHRGERWYPGDTVSVAIGQGLLATTPLQLATAVAAVATGQLPVPHVHAGGGAESQPISITPETLRLVRRAMERAVREGTARRAAIDGIVVAGKTGTAQVYKSSAGVDSDDLPKEERDHAWFVGYAGVDEPQIAFAVVVERGGHGGATAAPVARQVLEVYFSERRPGASSDLRAGADSPAGERGDR